jgi:hypothetical protein
MKIFLRKIVTAGFWVIIALLIITIGNYIFINNSKFFAFEKNKNILILGDSHTKYALNDSIITNSYNFSEDADSYLYSYLKLKIIKQKNPQIDTLLLAFSEHNLDKDIEDKWLFNSLQLHDRMRYYYPLFEKKEIKLVLNNNPKSVFYNLFSQILNPIYFVWKGNSVYGGYTILEKNNLSKEIKNQKKIDKLSKTKYSISKIEMEYLKKIKSFCAQNNIKLIFINTPLHQLVNDEQKNIKIIHTKYFSDVLFLDYSNLNMSDKCFVDLVHLSEKGSHYFSEFIFNNGSLNLKTIDIRKMER